MSKPMLVTMPAVLLLLDDRPLHRSPDDLSWQCWRPLLKEKLPFLALAIASSYITIVAQAKAHSVKIFLPLGLRLENAVVVLVWHLTKAFWPAHLSVFYPHPNTRFGLPQADSRIRFRNNGRYGSSCSAQLSWWPYPYSWCARDDAWPGSRLVGSGSSLRCYQ